MIMIIAIIYIFYLMWHLINSWKLLSENPQAPLKKSTLPFLLIPPHKKSKISSSALLANIENFSGPSAERVDDTGYPSIKLWFKSSMIRYKDIF